MPQGADYGYTIDKRMGELAPDLGVEPELYRALRPEALATLIYMTSRSARSTTARASSP